MGSILLKEALAFTKVLSTVRCSLVIRPWLMHWRMIPSKMSWNIPLSLKRPCRFLEKVEWSGTSSFILRPTNHLYPICILTSSHSLLSEVIPYRYPIRSIRIITSGSMDGLPISLYKRFTFLWIKEKSTYWSTSLKMWLSGIMSDMLK